jgi:hypothetical protein
MPSSRQTNATAAERDTADSNLNLISSVPPGAGKITCRPYEVGWENKHGLCTKFLQLGCRRQL